MIELTAKNYDGVVQSKRRDWIKYSSQLLNLANSNTKGTVKEKIGSVKENWQEMRDQNVAGTLENWTNFYIEKYGEKQLERSGQDVYIMIQKLRKTLEQVTEDMCVEYVKEVVYNKTAMGMGGEEMAIQVVANYFNMPYRYSTAEEETQGIDGWIGDKPVQVKPHDSVFKAHVYNHADTSKTLVVTYEPKKKKCYIHNPEFMNMPN